MILRNKICIFALIISLLLFAITFRHLAVGKLTIIRPEHKFNPPPLAPNPHNDTLQTGHGRHDNDDQIGPKVWTLEEWIKESEEAHELEIKNRDRSALKEICEKTQWRDDLMFECLHDPEHPRSAILTCLRYAIDAGAAVYFRAFEPQETEEGWFDKDHHPLYDNTLFRYNFLADACPGLEVWPRIGVYMDSLGAMSRAPVLHPDELPHWSLLGNSPVTSVRNYAEKLANGNRGTKTVIPFGPVSNYYPVCTDHASVVDAVGSLLPLGGRTLKELASKVLYHLHTNHTIATSPSNPSTPSHSDINNDKDKSGFLALRFETPSSWIHDEVAEPTNVPPYDRQRDYFLKRMRDRKHGAHGVKVVYVSASDAVFNKFVKDTMKEFGAGAPESQTVTFLGASELGGEKSDEFEKLDIVSRDVVDYLVMLRAQYFLGISESEISWAVANKRRIKSKTGTCGMRKPWSTWLWGSAMSDEWSDLMGDRKDEREEKMWP